MRTAERQEVHLGRHQFPMYLLAPFAFVWLWGLVWFGSGVRASGFATLFFLSFATLDEVLRRVFPRRHT